MAAKRTYYTLSEAAEVLGVHYETAARWARTGKLPAVKLSRRKVLVPKEKCHAFLAGKSIAEKMAALPFGSPRKWLALAGTLTPEEADMIMASVNERFEKVEE